MFCTIPVSVKRSSPSLFPEPQFASMFCEQLLHPSAVGLPQAFSATTLCCLKVICRFGSHSREFFACKSSLSHAMVEVKSWHNFSSFVFLYQGRKKKWKALKTNTVCRSWSSGKPCWLFKRVMVLSKHPWGKIQSQHRRGGHPRKQIIWKSEW